MKTMCLAAPDDPPALILREVPTPTPAADEVLVRVHAAGVTPTEMQWHPTTHMKTGEVRRHAVPGHEFSGVIEAVGSAVTEFGAGDEVYGMNDWFADGATAEYCLTVPASLAHKPTRLSHPEAASVPIGALTAWQALFERAKLLHGERILIHGGAGAVGVYAIQLARGMGAQIFTTASERHRDFLEQLGADHVIDYRNERFENQVRNMDVIFDGVGGETLERSWAVLSPVGRMVTIAASGEGAQDARSKAAFFIVQPNQRQLTDIASLLNQGHLKPFVDGVVPFAQASSAYFGGGTARPTGRGKVVISIP
jgi:NADPH:quinone reductase-like Zn-dependent oxidoreductase